MTDDFGFYFEEAGFSAFQGPTSSAEEHFKEIGLADSLVREMGQNSLDAKRKDTDGPVRMQFELRTVSVEEIPDYGALCRHIRAAEETTRDIDEANDRLTIASEATQKTKIPVLRIGDYETTGLTGREDNDSSNSPLVALTRAKGVSSGKKGEGGSFGVGASTGALASNIRTVLWTSLPVDAEEVVFAAQSQLATHKIDGVRRGPDGFFINRAKKDNFHYLRSPGPIGSFDQRKQVGTDTYILDYCDADRDTELTRIRNAFIRHFFVAIHRGKLEVEGQTEKGRVWKLDAESLERYVKDLPDVQPFYRAIHNKPYVENVSGLGELKLYVEFDDALETKLHTMAMRAPLMKITSFKHNSIRHKYAAVFICEDAEGNQKLRGLEPPAHDKWVEGRAKEGKRYVKQVKEFIRAGLKAQQSEEIGDEVDIPELNKLLPAGLGSVEQEPPRITGTQPATQSDAIDETAKVHGDSQPVQPDQYKRESYSVGLHAPGLMGEGEEALGGNRTRKTSKKRSEGGNLSTSAQKGNGSASISDANLGIRSWSDARTEDLIVVLTSDREAKGDVFLVPLSEGGKPEEDVLLPIKNVYLEENGISREITFDGNVLKDIEFTKTTSRVSSVKVRISLTNSERFSLGLR
ncbi:hypothetical protein [Corynebacterium auriscanis]|uniref:hypothetical protein n=1 Tax=Corynebacterium auriscanis TaxID=99807 RepID=UPI003CF2FB26